MNIAGTTLKIIKETGSTVLCECSTCGTVDSYNKKYVLEKGQECRYCKSIKSGMDIPEIPELTPMQERRLTHEERTRRNYAINTRNKIIDNRVLNKLLKEEENIKNGVTTKNLKNRTEYIETSKSPTKGFPIGHIIKTEQIDCTVIAYTGKITKEGRRLMVDKAVLRCNKCGTLYRADLNMASTCFVCTYFKSKSKERVEEFNSKLTERAKQQAIQKQAKLSSAKPAVEDNELREKQKMEEQLRKQEEKKTLKIMKEKEKTAKEIAKIIKEANEVNPTYHTYVKKTDTGYTIKYICKSCGMIETFNNRNKNKKIRKCEGCEKKNSFSFFTGTMKKNYVGTVLNSIRLTKQYEDESGYKCDLACTCCGKQFNGVHLIEFLEKEIICGCSTSDKFVECDSCGTTFFMPLMNILESDESPVCPRCNGKIDVHKMRNEIQSDDAAKTLKDKINNFGENISNNEIEKIGTSDLIREAKCLYAGTDGREYFRCSCLVHNVNMVLSQTEIDNFDHSQCLDGRQRVLSRPDGEKLKLK